MSENNEFMKRVTAILDYKFDWKPFTHGVPGVETDYLVAGETILTAVVTAETGLTVDSYAITDSGTSVGCWLSGGTKDTDYEVTCTITTSVTPRKDPRAITIQVRQR